MKYLYFETDGDETSGVCIPASSVVGLDVHTNNQTLEIFFNDLGAANANDGSVVIACNAGKTKEAAEDIAKAKRLKNEIQRQRLIRSRLCRNWSLYGC